MNSQQMIQSLLPIRDAHNGSVCMNCMQPHAHLVRCAACKRVKYCGKACQTNDWSKHKPVCKIMRAFQAASTEMPDIRGGKSNMGIKFNRFRKMVEEDLVPRSSLNLPRNISEDSWKMATKSVLRSPCCAICKQSDYDFNRVEMQWKCCPRCNYGWCCADHFEEYQPRHTTELCIKYVEASKIDRFRYNHTVNHGERFMLVPEHPLPAPMGTFPTSWEEYFQLRTPMEYQMRNQILPLEFFPTATFLLSQPVACLYGMYQHDRDFFTTAEELTIHVVGANAAFECEGGAPTCVWEEIMHCLPSVKTMNVIFVGPEVNIRNYSRLFAVQGCPDCCSKDRVRKQAFHELTYHDYYASDEFVKPDLVVAFNTGMYEEYTDSWKQSLEVMLTLDVPCMFTSYNKHEGDADFDVLVEVNARTLTDSTVLNPFRVNFPKLDDGCIDKFFQDNMYYICFRGRNLG